MRATQNIEPLVDLATQEFNRLMDNTHESVNALAAFWTKLYGPNEVAESFRDLLDKMYDEFHEVS